MKHTEEWEDGYNRGVLEGIDRADKIMTKVWKKVMKKWDKANTEEEIEKDLRRRLGSRSI